jgi:hypothetical protein
MGKKWAIFREYKPWIVLLITQWSVVQNFSSFFGSIWLTRPLIIYNTVHWSVRHTQSFRCPLIYPIKWNNEKFCTTKCLLSVIGVIIWERSNLLGKQGMISCTWMKHGLTKITAQIICGFRMMGLMPQKYPRAKANVCLFCIQVREMTMIYSSYHLCSLLKTEVLYN